jgi:large-conductance mechanosensitive channel
MINGYDDSAVMGFGYWLGWLVGLIFLAIIIVLIVRIITQKYKLKKSNKKGSSPADNSERKD